MISPIIPLLISFINDENLADHQVKLLMQAGYVAFTDAGELYVTPAGYAELNPPELGNNS